jgi:hypothetical protein
VPDTDTTELGLARQRSLPGALWTTVDAPEQMPDVV